MKALHLLTLCLFGLLKAHAESPMQESSPALYFDSLDKAEEESFSVEDKHSFLDDECEGFKEELYVLEESLGKQDEYSEKNPFATASSDLHSLTIDISKPLNSLEDTFSLEIIEEKMAEPVIAKTSQSSPQATRVSSESQNSHHGIEQKKSLPLEDTTASLSIESSTSEIEKNLDVQLDLMSAFTGSPLIYILLFSMSMFSVFVWLYSLLSLKKTSNVPDPLLNSLQNNLNSNHFDEALSLCNSHDALLCKMVATGIRSRKYGPSVMVESMKAEGKRSSMGFWQKIGLLNDVAILAPMLGLLGTVIGMFYAFYDVNRSIESITSLFDGLGISVGTTVAGLVVAILALILHSTAKYRLIKVLSHTESEAHRVASLIDDHTSVNSNVSQ